MTTTAINRKTFFDIIRVSLFGGHLSDSQVQGINVILDEWEQQGLTDLRWLAYMLATTFHETQYTMQAVEEQGKGKGRSYGQKLKRGGGPGKRIPYISPDKLYYGRGYVQLTWYENYEAMARLLHIDLLNQPELALQADVACKILFEGMLKANSHFGDFTGVSLEHYFNDTTTDWVNARKIINGLDRAKIIAGYGKKFYAALTN